MSDPHFVVPPIVITIILFRIFKRPVQAFYARIVTDLEAKHGKDAAARKIDRFSKIALYSVLSVIAAILAGGIFYLAYG